MTFRVTNLVECEEKNKFISDKQRAKHVYPV